MWRLDNKTRFPVESMFYLDKEGISHWTVICKTTWDMKREKIQLAETSKKIVLSDKYINDDPELALIYGTDLNPLKGKTDIVIKGYAYCPFNRSDFYDVEMHFGKIMKKVRVRKEREIEGGIIGSKIITKGFLDKVSLGYENAYGGKYKSADGEQVYPDNPAGKGFTDINKIKAGGVLLPYLEYPEQPYKSWKKNIAPAAFGYIPPCWESRKTLAGSYDQEWFEKKFPLYPDDFSSQFWQQAAEDQQYPGEIMGGEELILTNMTFSGNHRNIFPDKKDIYFLKLQALQGNIQLSVDYHINTILIELEEMLLQIVFAAELDYDPDEDEDIKLLIEDLRESKV